MLKPLPNPRDSVKLFNDSVAVNNRGLYLPDPTFLPGAGFVGISFLLGIAGTIAYRLWARQDQAKTGKQHPVALYQSL